MESKRNKLQLAHQPPSIQPASQHHCVCTSVKVCVCVSYRLCEGKIKGKCGGGGAKKDAELNTSNTFTLNTQAGSRIAFMCPAWRNNETNLNMTVEDALLCYCHWQLE